MTIADARPGQAVVGPSGTEYVVGELLHTGRLRLYTDWPTQDWASRGNTLDGTLDVDAVAFAGFRPK